MKQWKRQLLEMQSSRLRGARLCATGEKQAESFYDACLARIAKKLKGK